MKKIIKNLLGNRFLRNFFNLSWNPYYEITFHDVASNFSEAVNKINKSKKFNQLKETYLLLNKDIKDIKNITIDESDIHSFVPLLISITNNSENKIKSILDIGGGINPVSFYIKKYCNIQIKSCVIETENYTKKLNDIISKKHNYIEYFSSFDNLNISEFDLIYFGSSLQYFEGNEYKILKKTISYNPKFVVFTRNFFTYEDEDSFSLQSCGRYHLIPHTFFSYNKMINFFKKEGYKLTFETNHMNIYKHKKMSTKDFKFKSLVFSK